jgi:hypothetical protein
MLPRGLNTLYREALAASHQAYVRVEVLDGNQNVLDDDVVFTGGSVSATLTSRVSRVCDLTLSEDLYPFQETDLFAPYGNMVRATRGIQFADGSKFAWVVFVGRIQEARLNTNGTCVIRASDFAADVIENKFLTPQNSQTGQLVSQEITRLIADGFPQAAFAPFSITDLPVKPLTWQLERGQALDELATSVGAFWYPLADGTFTARTYPWTVPSEPVVTYSDKDSGGSVSASGAARSREGVFNTLTVTGERLNGDTPAYATAADTNPTSITRVGGPFGVRSQLLRLQTVASQGSAQNAAGDNLRRLMALSDTWAWEMSPDAALELGDTVRLNVHGRTNIIQVVASFSIPLDLSRGMSVQGRSRVAGQLEGTA